MAALTGLAEAHGITGGYSGSTGSDEHVTLWKNFVLAKVISPFLIQR
jgi:hypothetical protein